jgi:hypothetical protein
MMDPRESRRRGRLALQSVPIVLSGGKGNRADAFSTSTVGDFLLMKVFSDGFCIGVLIYWLLSMLPI